MNKKAGIYFFILLVLFLSNKGRAYYYFNDFTNPAIVSNDFDVSFRYGRGGVTYCPSASTLDISGGILTLGGRVNDSDVDYIGTWVGRMVKFTNRLFVATEYNPFGILIVRKECRLDPQQEIDTPNNPESWRHVNAMSFWLFVETGLSSSSPEGSSYNDFILMYDMMRDVFNTNDNGKPFSTWGKYISSESRFDLSSVIRADGTTIIDINNNTNYQPEWCYENNYGAGTGYGALDGTTNDNSTNTNTIALMMTHNGSEVKFYINPNYNSDPANPYPNEFLLLGSANVAWNSNISFMFGQESKRYDTEMEYFQIDSVLIREVTSNSIAEIYPNEVITNKQVQYTIIITNIISPNDAGIGEIEIEKPTGFSMWDISSIEVYTYYGTGAASSNISTLNKLSNITTGTLAADGEVLIKTNNQKLKLQFCYGTSASATSNVITTATPDKRIEIRFVLTSPSTPIPEGAEFKVYVNCVKYNGSRYSRYATTGKKRCYSGNATGIFTTDSLLVKTYANVQAVASISPNEVYEGTDNLFYYYLSTESSNPGPYITCLEIEIPSGFNVTSADVSSLKINDDANYVYVTNNRIIVDYAGDGSIFPAQSGLDRIDIYAWGTPDIVQASNVYWPSIVYSSVLGSTPSYTTTNSFYESQSVLIKLQPPNATAYILPSLIYNHTVVNSFQYIVENNGDPGNKIQYIKIIIPDVFTNASNFDSTIGNSSCFTAVFGPTNYILIDYSKAGTNLDGGYADTITFDLYDSIPALSAPTSYNFPSYADNNNGDGFVPLIEDSAGWKVDVVSPDPQGAGSIFKRTDWASSTNTKSFYTSDVSNMFQYKIYNDGEEGNDILIAKIIVPSSFTQIYNVESTIKLVAASDIKVTNNEIIIAYTNKGNLKSGEWDEITFIVKDNITLPGDYTFELEVANGKNNFAWYSTGNFFTENKIVSAVYPPLMAKAFVKVDTDPNNIIDSSTATNSLTYYITNYGDPGNDIKELRIYFPTNGSIVECINIDSAIVTNSINERWVSSGNYIFIDYFNDGNLLTGKTNDIITFEMIDNISGYTSFQIPIKAKNDLEEGYLPDITGETQWVFIQVPPAYGRGRIYPNSIFVVPAGTTNTNILYYEIENYGTGANTLKRARIIIPSIFSGKIQNVSSSHLTNEASSLSVTSSYIILDYAAENNPLPAGTTDTVSFELLNDITNTGDYIWELEVDNGDTNGYVSTTTISNGTKVLSVIRRAFCAISKQYDSYPPTVEVLTPVTRSTLYYKLNNSGGNLDIREAKIIVPSPFITNNIYVDPTFSGIASASYIITNISGTNAIIISYPAGEFTPGKVNIIEIRVDDNWTTGETNCDWSSFVDYYDGQGFLATYVSSNSTITVQFKFPPVYAKSYSAPNDIMIDKEKELYTVVITNMDPSGNRIRLIKISLPECITNVTSITSAFIGTNITYNTSLNCLFLNYEANGTNIPPQYKEIITFYAYDNITNAQTNQFIVYVANTTNTNDLVVSDILTGKSLALNFYHPGYKASVYITPTLQNTVLTTNTHTYYIINTGSGTNYINAVKIYFSTNIYLTNSISVLPQRKCSVSIGNGYILLNYSASNTNIKPGETESVNITILDKLKYGNYNTTWNSEIRYNTSFSNYKTPDILSGESINVQFRMPKPSGNISSIYPDEIPITKSKFNLNIEITNTGEGSNDIFKIIISLPSVFTQQNISASNINSLIGSNISVTDIQIIISYTNFTPGKSDTIVIDSLNTPDSAGTYILTVKASNSTYSTNFYGDNSFNVVTPPSAYVSPDMVFSTLKSNTYQFHILNNGTGSSNIKLAKIYYPSLLTNISKITSLVIVNISNITIVTSSNYILIDYKNDGNEISPGSEDTISITAYDSIPYGYTNVLWKCEVDTGMGLVSTFTEVGRKLDVTYYMPDADVAGYITPNEIYTTETSNHFVIYVTNRGEFDNSILKMKIYLPDIFTNIINLTNKYNSYNQYIESSNLIIINYLTNDIALAGETSDLIQFDSFKIETSATDVVVRVYVFNGSTNGFVQIPAVAGKSFEINIRFPESIPRTYLDTPEIYTIKTQEKIVYKIAPGDIASGAKPVKMAEIDFNTNLLNITKITSVYLGANSTNSNYVSILSNKIRIVYSNYAALSNEDTVNIYVSYHLQIVTNIPMHCTVVYGTNKRRGIVPNGETDILGIVKAPWGIIRGDVIPLYQTINIKIFRKGENSIALDADGYELSTYNNPDTGYFELEKILPGEYVLILESERLKQYQYPFTMYSNTILSNISIQMHNKPFNADANYNQTGLSYDDYKSSLILPPGSFEKDFSVDIYIEPIALYPTLLVPDFKASPYINGKTTNGVNIYRFELRGIDDAELEGVALLKDATLKLYYPDTLLSSTGWKENNLGIFYFKESTRKWIPIGGKLDEANNCITAHINYVAHYFGVFEKSIVNSKGILRNIIVTPRVFTPKRGGDSFNMVRISFDLERPINTYSVYIYDISGKLIRKIERSGEFAQGNIIWDGQDEDGYIVKSGVYIYKIKAADEEYTGTILVVK